MRKYLLLIGVIISMTFQGFATKNDVYMTVRKTNHKEQSSTVHRAPMMLPIEVLYDNETHQVEVVGDEELPAQVFLCDQNGNTLGYSPCINTVLDVPSDYNGILIIRVESEEWIATGNLIL